MNGASASIEPVVSAIVIFLNAESFIEEAIASVFAQTYERWELLLVDDGSTDGSTAIARRYAHQRPDRVYYLDHPNHENRGTSASRNLGVRHARGEYVALLDADDVWLPHKLEQQVALMEQYPDAGMVCGASLYWYSWTGNPEHIGYDRVALVGAPQNVLVRPPGLLALLHPLATGAAPCVASLLVRRNIVEAVRGFEEQFVGVYQRYEDQAFLSKLYLSTPVFVSSVCCDKYRQHAGSCMAMTRTASLRDKARVFFLFWFERHLEGLGYAHPEVCKLLQDALWPYRHPILSCLINWWQQPGREARRLVVRLLRRTLPPSVFLKLQVRFSRDPFVVVRTAKLARARSSAQRVR